MDTKIWVEIAQKALKYKQLRKHYENLEKKHMEELKKLSDYKNHEEEGFRLTFTERLGAISYKDIPYLKSINLDIYRKNNIIMATLESYDVLLEESINRAEKELSSQFEVEI